MPFVFLFFSQVALVKLVDMFIEEKDFLCSLVSPFKSSVNAVDLTHSQLNKIKNPPLYS